MIMMISPSKESLRRLGSKRCTKHNNTTTVVYVFFIHSATHWLSCCIFILYIGLLFQLSMYMTLLPRYLPMGKREGWSHICYVACIKDFILKTRYNTLGVRYISQSYIWYTHHILDKTHKFQHSLTAMTFSNKEWL